MKNYKFTKEKDRWYINLPEWEGNKEDLEMVSGADTMLDILAQGEEEINVTISTEPFYGYFISLYFQEEAYGGANYDLISEMHSFPVWLCCVTKFVFGKFPEIIYIK